MISIDGSYGEGGGQVLRTSLALSLVTGQPFRIEKIRAGRKKPGLLHQHLASVKAAARIGSAACEGAELGSQALAFAPQAINPGRYEFAVGTAGSCTLVLQTVLPALLTASGPSELILEGGTHNPFAPPFDFLAKTFLPIVNRMGPRVNATLERPGFYPAGGGRMIVTIEPSSSLSQVDLVERGDVRRCEARAVISNLPRQIAERELTVLGSRLRWKQDRLKVEEITNSRGPGNAIIIEIESEHITEVFTAFGRRGVRAEQVAAEAADAVEFYFNAQVPVGEYLADQLLIPMALAGGGRFRTTRPTDHSRTNIDVIRKFFDVDIDISMTETAACLVALCGAQSR